MRKPWLLLGPLALAFLVVGCPNGKPTDGKDPNGNTDGAADGKQPGDGTADGKTPEGGSKDPLEGSVFTKDMHFEVYAADMQGGDAKLAAHKKHRLADKDGKPLPTRLAAYRRALQRYAKGDPEGWSAFLETLSR